MLLVEHYTDFGCFCFCFQLILFGLSNQLVVSFKEENTVAFKHLFLKDYPGVDEDDYSRSVYTQQDVYDSIFFAINQVSFLCKQYAMNGIKS